MSFCLKVQRDVLVCDHSVFVHTFPLLMLVADFVDDVPFTVLLILSLVGLWFLCNLICQMVFYLQRSLVNFIGWSSCVWPFAPWSGGAIHLLLVSLALVVMWGGCPPSWCLLSIFLSIGVFQLFHVWPFVRPCVVHRGVQTDTNFETALPDTIFTTRAGKCYHLSSKCPINGSMMQIETLRRCQNCAGH